MKALRNDRGMALVVIIMMMTILLTISGAGLLLSGLNLKTTSNLKLGTIALQAADAGLQHAVIAVPWDTNFKYDALTTVLTGAQTTGYTYTVTAINDGGNTRAKLTSTITGPSNTKKVIVGYVQRSAGSGGGPGAVYLPGTAGNIETRFDGNSFLISGYDTNVDGTPGSKPPGWGISTTDAATVTEITNDTTTDGGLTAQQMDNVIGVGGDPSVGATTEMTPSPTEIADAFLQSPHTELVGNQFTGNETWGTDANPQITRITPGKDNKVITIAGNVTGTGVLIIDGPVDIQGTIDFHGLIIARGRVEIALLGTATIHGSIYIAKQDAADGGSELDVRGNASVYYSSQALSWINNNWPGTLPQPARLVAWQEVM